MGRVSGHVYLAERVRGDQWYMKYRFPSGKDERKRIGAAWQGPGRPPSGHFTEKMAEEVLQAKLVDIRRGEIPDPGERSDRTFADAVAEWLRCGKVEKDLRASTLRDYRNTANGALIPEFGTDTPLEEINTERIDAYRSRLLAEGELSRRSVKKRLVTLSGIFNRARKLGWISSNPVEQADTVEIRRSGDFNVLTVDQVEAVAREASSPMYAAAITVAAYTGLRTGEARALRWSAVDFAAGIIHVRENLPMKGELGPPKSGTVRSVPLMDDAARELFALSRRGDFTGPRDFVFCSTRGEVLGEDTLRHALYRAMEVAGIDRKAFPVGTGFRFHDLRHTFATLAAAIWPLHDVQAYCGHSDIKTTMRYVHHVPRRDAAAAFTRYIESQRSGTVVTISGHARDTLGSEAA